MSGKLLKPILCFAVTVLAATAGGCGLIGGQSGTSPDEQTEVQAAITPEVAEYCAALEEYTVRADSLTTLREYMRFDWRPVERLGKVDVELTDADRNLLGTTLVNAAKKRQNIYFRLCHDAGIDIQAQLFSFNERVINLNEKNVAEMMNRATTLPEAITNIKNYFEL